MLQLCRKLSEQESNELYTVVRDDDDDDDDDDDGKEQEHEKSAKLLKNKTRRKILFIPGGIWNMLVLYCI